MTLDPETIDRLNAEPPKVNPEDDPAALLRHARDAMRNAKRFESLGQYKLAKLRRADAAALRERACDLLKRSAAKVLYLYPPA